MAYVNIDRSSGSTLTADERAEEAKRILARFRDFDIDQLLADGTLTENAACFLTDKLDELETFNRAQVSINQLFWLRDLNSRVD